jgi:GR25 family glycosyltransferase involved in LPS biosynthesis
MDSVYCINLDESTDRWDRIKKQEHLLGQTITRVSAIHYRDIDRRTDATLVCNTFCTDTAIAIFQSHRKIWQMIIEKGETACLILEDDVTFEPDTVEYALRAIDELNINHPNWDILYLGNLMDDFDKTTDLLSRIRGTNHRPTKCCNKCQNVYRPRYVLGAHAYVLSQKGAQTLQQLFPKVNNAVDMAILDTYNVIEVFNTKKDLVKQNSQIESTQPNGSYPRILNVFDSIKNGKGQPYHRMLSVVVFQVHNIKITGFFTLLLLLCLFAPVQWVRALVTVLTCIFIFEYAMDQKLMILQHWVILVYFLLLKERIANLKT